MKLHQEGIFIQNPISLKALFEKFGENLTYGSVVKDTDTKTGTDYYNLYFDRKLLACSEGDMCKIIHCGKERFALSSTRSKEDIDIFSLSYEEFNVAFNR